MCFVSQHSLSPLCVCISPPADWPKGCIPSQSSAQGESSSLLQVGSFSLLLGLMPCNLMNTISADIPELLRDRVSTKKLHNFRDTGYCWDTCIILRVCSVLISDSLFLSLTAAWWEKDAALIESAGILVRRTWSSACRFIISTSIEQICRSGCSQIF